MRKLGFLIAITILFCLPAIGQQITNIVANKLDDNIIRVTYDLEGEVPGQQFTVSLYSSANEFSLPLEYVDGYVGERVEAGVNKFIDWDISKELVAFEGALSFEVRAELTFTPINVNFPDNSNVTRGKEHLISWRGTNIRERVDIQLYRDGKKLGTIANTVNDGQYQWTVPFSTKPGNGYTVKISSTSSSQTDSGTEFSIHRKIPLILKLIPMAAVVPLVISLTDEEPEGPRILPAPPNTPD